MLQSKIVTVDITTVQPPLWAHGSSKLPDQRASCSTKRQEITARTNDHAFLASRQHDICPAHVLQEPYAFRTN